MKAQLASAQLTLQRDTQLIKSRVIDQQTYNTQKYTTDQLQALVRADQAAIDNAQTQLDYAHLVAPISGRVGIRLIDPGNIVHSSDTGGIVDDQPSGANFRALHAFSTTPGQGS